MCCMINSNVLYGRACRDQDRFGVAGTPSCAQGEPTGLSGIIGGNPLSGWRLVVKFSIKWREFGSPAGSVIWLYPVDYALTQQVDLRSPKHLSLDQLESVDMALHLALTPGHG